MIRQLLVIGTFFLFIQQLVIVGRPVLADFEIGIGSEVGQAAEKPTLSIHILKYALDPNQSDQKQNELNAMAGYRPLANVRYRIQQVTPTGDTKKLKGTDSRTYHTTGFDLLIQTNDSGEASVDSTNTPQFGAGFYLVTELADQTVKTPMDPVIVQVPEKSAVDGSQINDVYLYPKSNVASSGHFPNTQASAAKKNPAKPKRPKRAKKTREGTVTVRFVDEEGHKLHADIKLRKEVGAHYSTHRYAHLGEYRK